MSQTDIVQELMYPNVYGALGIRQKAADTITQLRERLDEVTKSNTAWATAARLWEHLTMKAAAERDQLRLSNERLREALQSIAEYWNGSTNETAMRDACERNSRFADEVLALTAESGTEGKG